MELVALITYGVINLAMVSYYLLAGKTRYFEFPFWFGALGLGWFYPQAIGAYYNIDLLPAGYYAKGMLFATFCSLATWMGYVQSSQANNSRDKNKWLTQEYEPTRLHYSCVILCLLGMFFFYKLQTLPKELLQQNLWTGRPVMYLFLSNMFKIGFIGLFILYLRQKNLLDSRFFLLVPCIALMLFPIVFAGRRGEMIRFISAILFPLWFVRRVAIPRIWIVIGLVSGLILINAIGLYRSVMADTQGLPLEERLRLASQQNYAEENRARFQKTGPEFMNFMYEMAAVEKVGVYDFGLRHWNESVFNYVPAQLVGRSLKQSLMIDWVVHPMVSAKRVFGYVGAGGATDTGYMDAFASFSYFGVIKFWIIGVMMGVLYKKAMMGFILPQLLYALALNAAMHSISHTTNEILIRIWVYFFIFGFFPIYYSRREPAYPERHGIL